MTTKHLTITPIMWDRVTYLNRWAAQDGCGALVTFVGVVRPDQSGSRRVRALFYEAYAEMAERAIDRVVSAARAQGSLDAVRIQHRLGLVEAGQISVVVVAAAQHRFQAYTASRFLIEQIKQEVPIWKQEQYDDGTSQWVINAPSENLSPLEDARGGVW